jgi:hypothetical protein
MMITEGVEARRAGIKQPCQGPEREKMTGSIPAEIRNMNGKKNSFKTVGE